MGDPAEEFRKQKKYNNLLLVASARGLVADVTELLHLGADIECRDKEGYTPVHFAAARGRLDILSLLWSKSADIDAETPTGRTPLHLAAFSGHAAIASFLLSKGALISAEDSQQCTPLHAAARTGNVEAVEVLLQGGASTSAVDALGLTPAGAALLAGHIETVQILVEWGAKLQERPKGYSLLHLSAGLGRSYSVEWLLQRPEVKQGIDDNEEKVTPLHCAAISGNLATVALLVQHGACATARDARGNLPSDRILAGSTDSQALKCKNLLLDAAMEGSSTGDNANQASELPFATTDLPDSRSSSSGETGPPLPKLAAFTSLPVAEQQATARRWSSMTEDKDALRRALQGYPGNEEAMRRAHAAAAVRRRVNIFKALASLRGDQEFQEDMSQKSVSEAVEILRKDPSQYDRFAVDPRIGSVLSKMRRVHGALQVHGQRTMSLLDVTVPPESIETQKQKDNAVVNAMEAEFTGHVWAAAAAAGAVAASEGEAAATAAFEMGRISGRPISNEKSLKSAESEASKQIDDESCGEELPRISWSAYLKRQLLVTALTLLLALIASQWVKRAHGPMPTKQQNEL